MLDVRMSLPNLTTKWQMTKKYWSILMVSWWRTVHCVIIWLPSIYSGWYFCSKIKQDLIVKYISEAKMPLRLQEKPQQWIRWTVDVILTRWHEVRNINHGISKFNASPPSLLTFFKSNQSTSEWIIQTLSFVTSKRFLKVVYWRRATVTNFYLE